MKAKGSSLVVDSTLENVCSVAAPSVVTNLCICKEIAQLENRELTSLKTNSVYDRGLHIFDREKFGFTLFERAGFIFA